MTSREDNPEKESESHKVEPKETHKVKKERKVVEPKSGWYLKSVSFVLIGIFTTFYLIKSNLKATIVESDMYWNIFFKDTSSPPQQENPQIVVPQEPPTPI